MFRMFLSETYGMYDYDWSGTNVTVTKNNDEITISNTVRGTQRCILHELDGETPSFVFEFDSYASNTVRDGEMIGLGVKSNSDSRLTAIYTNTNQNNQLIWYNYSTSTNYENINTNLKNKWLHYKYSIGNDEFKLELSENGSIIYTRSLNLNSALLSATDLIYVFLLPYQPSSRLVKNMKITQL